MKRRSTLLLLILILAAPLRPTGAQPAADSPFSEVGRQAFALLQKDDLAGAVALLEPARAAGALTAADQALLGTLYLETGRPDQAAAVLEPLAERDDADPAVLYNAGRAALARGRTDVAERFLSRSVELVPRSPAARELGLLWGARGRSFDAYRLLRPWALGRPDDLEARTAAAALALRLDRESEAAELVEGLPEDDPKVALLRGQVLLQRGKPEEALAHLEPLRAAAPPAMRPDVLRLLADLYIHLGRSEEALAVAPEGPGGDLRLALLLATAHYRQGDVEAALATLRPFTETLPKASEATIDASPLSATLALEYGRLLVAAGRNEEAIPFLETAAKILPEDASTWKSLGDALLGAGRREEAIAARKTFQELSARQNERRRELQGQRSVEDATARSIVRARDALAAGEADRALDVLRREAQLSPTDVRSRLAEVSILLELGRAAEARARADETLERFPGHPDAVYQRGVVNLALRDTAAAEADLRRALELAPEHLPAMNDLAVLLMVQGVDAEAERLLERVLELRPDDETARRNLEELRAKAGG